MSDENMVPEIILTNVLNELASAQNTIKELTDTNADLISKLEGQTSMFLASKDQVKSAVFAASEIIKNILDGITRIEMSEKDKRKVELLSKKELIERELMITAQELESL